MARHSQPRWARVGKPRVSNLLPYAEFFGTGTEVLYKDTETMENQIDWAQVIRIMATGFGAVCVIMVLLSLATMFMGKVVAKIEKPKEDGKAAS